jgi:two-component system NtrC family sensor kinase
VTPSGEADLGWISASQLRAMLDSIPTRIALLDRERRYRYVNREYISFAGRPVGEILGRTVPAVLAEEVFADFHPQDARALAGETARWEGWLDYRAGRRYLQRLCVPLRDAAGAVEGYFIFNRDLTDLKQSEEALARQLAARAASDTLNAAIIATAHDCFITIDEAGQVVEFNPAAEQTFGRRRADVLGQKIGELIVPPALRPRHVEGFARYLRTGDSRIIGRRIEIDAMSGDGSIFPVELTITEVRLPERRLFTAHLRDLSAPRAAAAEIQRQREALHQSEKLAAFGSLLAGVAHELNNPLSIVIGNALMLAEEAESAAPALVERARRIQAAAERCGATVRSFLAMARQRDIVKRPVAIQVLLDASLRLLAYGMRSSGVTMEQDISPDLPLLSCDADQIQQVLTNLLLNANQALEAMPPPRRIWVAARVEDGWVYIEVADNGPGIADQIRSRVFDPFFTTKPAGTGTGIGLKVSRGIAEAHGGALTLAAPNGTGARFVLKLPLGQAGAADGAEANGAPAVAPPRAECTALIVDDEAEVARLLGEMLTAQGFHCDIAASGEAARTLLRGRDYDAILCDLRMPDMDGPALFAWLTEHKPHLCACTAFVTGDTLGATAGGFLADAGRPILEKPFVPAELRRLLAELLTNPAG